MSFQCKVCNKDVEPAQAKQTYDEFGQAMCKTCTEKYLNGDLRESNNENEATTPTETQETPADCTMEQEDNKISDVAVEPVKQTRRPIRKIIKLLSCAFEYSIFACQCLPTINNDITVLRVEFHKVGGAPRTLAGNHGCATTTKTIQNNVAALCVVH